MKKIALALVPLILFGCGGPENIVDSSYTAPVPEPVVLGDWEAEDSKSKFNFDERSKGKRRFQLSQSEKHNSLFGICSSLEQFGCRIEGRGADKIDGFIGYLDSESPVKEDRFYRYYRLILQNGDIYYLQSSKVHKGDILDSSLSLVDLDKKDEYTSRIGKPIKYGSKIIVKDVTMEGRLIYLELSTGEKVYVDDLEERVDLLKKIVPPERFDLAFPVSKDIYADYDEFERRWWLIPRLRFEMPAYFYAGVKRDGTKWLRATFRYHGSGWIFFDNAAVISGDLRYERDFSISEGTRDNDTNGVYESADIKVTNKEVKLFESMSKHGAKVRLSGKYQDTSEITEEQRVMLENLYKLYQLI